MPLIDVSKNKILLIKIFKFFDINIVEINDLLGVPMERDILLTKEAITFLKSLQDSMKEVGYRSGVMSALFKNNITKQKWPALNAIRQILKCNSLKLKPISKSNGYDKSTGKKIRIRSFIITKLPVKLDIINVPVVGIVDENVPDI